METTPYTATATIDGKKYSSTIELTPDQYAEFWNCEFNAQEFVVEKMKQHPALQDIRKLHAGVIIVLPQHT